MELRGAGHTVRTASWRSAFATGAVLWTVVHVIGWALRLGSARPHLGDLRLLYHLAGTGAVDSYLVGGARGLLLFLHILLAVAVGGLLTAALARLTDSLPRATLLSGAAALLLQIPFFLPISR